MLKIIVITLIIMAPSHSFADVIYSSCPGNYQQFKNLDIDLYPNPPGCLNSFNHTTNITFKANGPYKSTYDKLQAELNNYMNMPTGSKRQAEDNKVMMNFIGPALNSFMIDIKEEMPKFKDLGVEFEDADIKKTASNRIEIDDFDYDLTGTFVSSSIIPDQKMIIEKKGNGYKFSMTPDYFWESLVKRVFNHYDLDDYVLPSKVNFTLIPTEDGFKVNFFLKSKDCVSKTKYEKTLEKFEQAIIHGLSSKF